MKIVFAGTPEAAVPSLMAVLASRHDVAAVITRPDAPVGRGKTLTASPVAQVAAGNELPTLKPTSPRDEDFHQRLQDIQPDLGVVVAYGGLLPQSVLDIPRHGWVNVHFSLLPRWRGAAPVQRAIEAGDRETGVSVFQLEKDLDTGPIVGQETVSLSGTETSESLLTDLAKIGADLLTRVCDNIARGSAVYTPQSVEGVTHADKLMKAEGEVAWSKRGIDIDRHIRAYTADPGAWTTFRGQRIKIGPVALVDAAGYAPTGRLTGDDKRVLVRSADTWIELQQVAPAGKKWMPAADWARGARIGDEEKLGEDAA